MLIVLPYINPVFAGYFIFISLLAVPLLVVEIILFLATPKAHHHHHRHHRRRLRAADVWRYAYLLVPLATLYVLLPLFPVGSLFRHAPQGRTLRVVSWNVSNFGPHADTLESAVRQLLALQPDILCLQERPHTNLVAWETICARFPELPYTLRNSREDEVLNLAVLSRYPLGEPLEYYYQGSYNKSVAVDVQLPGTPITLYNVHLQTTGLSDGGREAPRTLLGQFVHYAKQRNRQALRLGEEVRQSSYPVLLCGDFNDTRTGYSYRLLCRYLHDVSPAFIGRGSYKKYLGLLKIDNVLASRHFKLASYRLIDTPTSDHKIQFCELSIAR